MIGSGRIAGAALAAMLLVGCAGSDPGRNDQSAETSVAAPPPSTLRPAQHRSATAVAPAGAVQCADGEPLLFHCEMQADSLALCVLPDPGAIRMRVRVAGTLRDAVIDARTVRLGTTGYAGGGEAYIRFVDREVAYRVFDRTVRTGFGPDGHHEPAFSAGIVETRASGESITRGCDNDASVTAHAYTHLEREPFVDLP